MCEAKLDKVKQWINTELKVYIEKNSDEFLEGIVESDGKLILDFNKFKIELSEDEIKEIYIILEEYDCTKKSYEINGIYNYEDEKYIIPLVSNKNKIIVDNKMISIKFLVDKNENRYFETTIENTISLRLIFILIKNEYDIKFSLIDNDGEYINDLVSCFNISYIIYDFENCKDIVNDEMISNITLSALYYINIITNELIVPKKLCRNSSLNYFNLHNNDDILNDTRITIPFNIYDLEPIIYYLVGKTHDDFRFKYLDIYHVLEFYFDRSALSNIRDLLKDELSNPILYFDDTLSNNLAKKLKNIIVGDKKNYKEEESLLLVLKLVKFEKLIEQVGQEVNDKIKISLPEIKAESKVHLSKIEIEYDKGSKEIKLNNSKVSEEQALNQLKKRIYAIRNSVAHSKEEFEWRLKPNSNEILKLEMLDLKLLTCISKNVLEYFKKDVLSS